MSTIATTTASPVFQYPSQAYIDIDIFNYDLWCLYRNTAGDFVLSKSTDHGATWADQISLTRANVQEWSNIYIDSFGFLHWSYRTNESNQDRVYYRRIWLKRSTLFWDAEFLTDAPGNGGVAGSVNTGLSITCALYGINWVYYRAVIAIGVNGATRGCWLTCVRGETWNANRWNETGPLAFNGTPNVWRPETGSGRITPAIGFQHWGDNRTALNGQPHLWVAFGRSNVYVVKCAWTGSNWVNPVAPVLVASNVAVLGATTARYDGQGVFGIVGAYAGSDQITLWGRNVANTFTWEFTSPPHPQGVITAVTYSYTPTNDRYYAVGTANQNVYYIDRNKAGGNWSSWTLLSATAALSGTNFGVREPAWPTYSYDTYMEQSGSPNTLVHAAQAISFPPDPPTWAAPINGAAGDVNAALLLDWNFTDPVPTDTQSAYALSRQIGAGTLAYWRASDSTWQPTEQQNTSGTSQLSLASGWAAGTDDPYTFKVKVWDQASTPSAYSSAMVVIPSVKVNPTLVTPGATIASNTVVASWTVAEQTAFRVRLTGGVTYDSGWVTSTDTSFVVPLVLTNGTSFTLTLNTKNNEGLSSSDVSQAVAVSYLAPAVPALVLTPVTATGMMQVAITNPAASGVSTYVGVGSISAGNNGPVTPTLPAGLQRMDLMVCSVSIRSSGTGTVNIPAGWSSLFAGGNFRLYYRFYQVGDTAPTITFNSGATGDTTIARIAAWRGAAVTVPPPAAADFSGPSQDIAYPALSIVNPGSTIIIAGWKQAVFTSVATAAGFTEISEDSSALGSGASQVWDYQIQTAATNITSGSLTVTGGTSAIHRGYVVALDPFPAFLRQDLYRRVVGDSSDGIRVAASLTASATYQDWTAVHGVNYEYRSLVYGANGTAVYSAWTS